MIRIATWYNVAARRHEATQITRGRPIKQNVSAEVRESSTRAFGFGTSKEEAVTALALALGVSATDLVDDSKNSKVVYKGQRQSAQPSA